MIRERLERLRGWMKGQGIDYYMIPTSDFHNSEYVHDYFKVREYFSGFTGSNGTLIVGGGTAGLWTDGRYFIQAENELKGSGITLFRMMEEGVPDIPEYLYENMENGQILGFDGRTVTCREGKRLEEKLRDKRIGFSYGLDAAAQLWKERPALPCHDLLVLPEEICGRSVEDKLQAVREKMTEAGAAYFVLSKLDDLMWLLNIRGGDIACNPVALSYGLITRREIYFFVQPAAVTEAFAAYAETHGIEVKPYEDAEGFLKAFDYDGKVMYDVSNSNYAFHKLLTARAACVEQTNPTELLKAVKNRVELTGMERVYLEDSAAVIKFIFWLKKHVGKERITEVSAAEKLDGLRAEIEGFMDLSFPTISAYGENAAMMHYEAVPGACRELKPEGLLLVDSGGQYMGGTTDVTRTIVLGEIGPQIKEHFTKVAAGMLRLTNAVFLYGCTGRNLDILARQPLWTIGIDYKCGTGHGIGHMLNVHEGPQSIRWRFAEGSGEAVLEEGMVLSNEPGVYIEGSHGIRTENIMAVKKGVKNGDGQFLHFDTLTFVPIDRDAIDISCMQERDAELLNRYHEEVYRRTAAYLDEEERAWLYEVTRPLQK